MGVLCVGVPLLLWLAMRCALFSKGVSVISDYSIIISVITELSRGFTKIILLFLIYFLCLFSLEFLHVPNTAYRPR